MKSFVINLERRPDRKEQVEKSFNEADFNDYQFFNAIDGKNLTCNLELYKLFLGNDFNWRKGVIGCALSHYKLWNLLTKDPNAKSFCIFEDDITLHKDFKQRFKQCEDFMINSDTDILFLGYHMFKHNTKNNNCHEYQNELLFKNYNSNFYIGGFFGYMISKRGAEKMVNYIEKNRIKHGIDYLIKLNSEVKIQECVPFLVNSDWVDTFESKVDSDIQKDMNILDIQIPDISQIVEINKNKYYYIEGLDSFNNDIKYVGNLSLEELDKMTQMYDECVGFNSLGFLKNKINKIECSQYVTGNNGLYIKINQKINSKIRVKMMCNWCSSLQLCNEWNHMSQGNYTWNDIKIVSDDRDIDYYVILNRPLTNTDFYIPEKTIIFHMEPWCFDENQKWGIKTWGEWAKPDKNKFLQVRSHDEYINVAMWQLNTTYNEFKNNKILKLNDNIISTIITSKYFDPGHIKRINFLKFLETKNDPIFSLHIYNRDNIHDFKNHVGAVNEDKNKGLIPYKYYFICENNSENNYITEKLWEPIISEALCFYWGCPNVSEYINPLAYIQLDMNDFEKSFNIIKDTISNNLWEERIDIIRTEKDKILDYYNFFPTLERIINQHTGSKR